MLVSYLNAIEKVLLAKSDIAKKAGHPNLRGGPREWFIEEFLVNHLPTSWEIGQGEIISRESIPSPSIDDYRNQNDLVIYRRDFPKISYSPKEKGYLIEGVVATLEIKSVLTKEALKKACESSWNCKSQISEVAAGLGLRANDNIRPIWKPSNILSYVVAYDGPKNISTVANWLPKIKGEIGIESEFLIDMIVVLGKGIVWRSGVFPAYKIPSVDDDADVWAYIEQGERNIYTLFAHLLTIGEISSNPPRIMNYINQLSKEGIKVI